MAWVTCLGSDILRLQLPGRGWPESSGLRPRRRHRGTEHAQTWRRLQGQRRQLREVPQQASTACGSLPGPSEEDRSLLGRRLAACVCPACWPPRPGTANPLVMWPQSDLSRQGLAQAPARLDTVGLKPQGLPGAWLPRGEGGWRVASAPPILRQRQPHGHSWLPRQDGVVAHVLCAAPGCPGTA